MSQPGKKQTKKKPPRQKVAMPWYRAEEWPRLQAISEDASDASLTYEQWLSYATKSMQALRRRRVQVIKVDVTASQLQSWAKKKGLPINGKTRTAFAISQVASMA